MPGRGSPRKSKLKLHECNSKCVCPIHKTTMFYWLQGDLHACQNTDCRFSDGVNLDDLRCTFTWDEPDYPTGWQRVTCTELQNYHGEFHTSRLGTIHPVAKEEDNS